MGEIIFDKSKRNLRLVYDRIQRRTVGSYLNREEVIFLAIGGYNRTHELLLVMGADPDGIAVFSELKLSTDFLKNSHMKDVVLIRKINYTTSSKTFETGGSRKMLDLGVADQLEESMMIYKVARRQVGQGSGKPTTDWVKPSIVILDDPSLNLQHSGHRFRNFQGLGFAQFRNRNADPHDIVRELEGVKPADYMMFAVYQSRDVDEGQLLNALNDLRVSATRQIDGSWYFKPTEYKRIVGSNELAQAIREVEELGITQLKSNKKIGKENARWIVIPHEAFDFKGFSYKDEDEIFHEELEREELSEEQFAIQQEELLNESLLQEFNANIRIGYAQATLKNSGMESLQTFMSDVDDIESEVDALSLLDGATTQKEYDHIKKYHLAYFIDGEFKDNYRNDSNYIGGKRLISIDVDEGDYTREQLEDKLQGQDLFGMIYPTARYYFDGSKRWRIILMADKEMDKESYKQTVAGVGELLDLSIDEASKKISQLMGYPIKQSDISLVVGTPVNVDQFQVTQPIYKDRPANVLPIKHSNKSLLDFDHAQARLMRQALESGVPVGHRNDTYRQIIMFLRDTYNNPEREAWHEEAQALESQVINQMYKDGLEEKEVQMICRS